MNNTVEEKVKEFNKEFVGLNLHPSVFKDLEIWLTKALSEAYEKGRNYGQGLGVEVQKQIRDETIMEMLILVNKENVKVAKKLSSKDQAYYLDGVQKALDLMEAELSKRKP